jgi:hypothetical protein
MEHPVFFFLGPFSKAANHVDVGSFQNFWHITVSGDLAGKQLGIQHVSLVHQVTVAVGSLLISGGAQHVPQPKDLKTL